MERPRHRKSKSTTAVEGIRKHADSHFYNNEPSKRDMHMFNTTRESSKCSIGEPMKKLIPDKMSKEREAKRRSAGVVARLMGLDDLPSRQHGHRQRKRYLSKVGQKDDHPFYRQSSNRSSLDDKGIKDVYEDLKESHVATQSKPSKRVSKLKIPEIAILERKLPIPKPSHRDEDLNALAEFGGNIGAANSNNEVLLKFQIQLETLCVKHANDLQCDPISSLYSQISILKPLNSEKYESNAKAWNTRGECLCKNDGRSHHNRKDAHLLDPPIRRSCAKSRSIQSYEIPVKHKLPTQIVVLKPRKSSDTMPSVLPPGFAHPHVRHRRCTSAENVRAAPRATSASLSDFQGISKPKYREGAKEITGEIKDTFASFDSRPISFKYSKERGYAGDESSNDVYDSDTNSMSDVMSIKPGKLFGRNNQSRGSADLSLNIEAKKRPSERWKMARKHQSEIITKGNTLGEMLESAEKSRRRVQLDVYNCRGDITFGLASDNVRHKWNGPSGISSKDGWKDGCTENQSISRSIAPPLSSKSWKISERQKVHSSYRHVTRDTMDQSKSRTMDGNISCIDGFSPKLQRSSSRGHVPCQDKYVVNIETPLETTSSLSKTKEKCELLEEQIMGFSEPESVIRCLPDLEASEIDIRDTFVCGQNDSILQEASIVISEEGPALSPYPAPGPETSESFSEAEHPSPISVLEATSSPSGSEGFRGIFDGLEELRKQLQLLKMDSTEVSTIVTDNDDFLSEIEEDHTLITKSWEDLYIVDLLIHSGLEKLHLQTFNAGWLSLQIPVDASIFDTLEKKYTDGIAERRSERKLLFDRINSLLLEIFLQDIDSCPWVKPAPRRFNSNLQNRGLKDELKTFLASEDKGTERSTTIKVIDIEMGWSSYRDDIFIIGKDIEKILTDELIMEIVATYR